MRNLGLSLILVVVTAVIGVGWLITEINYRNAQGREALDGELAAYHRLGRELALALDGHGDKQDFIGQWQAQSAFTLRLEERALFPVPTELAADFQANGSLVLQADDNVSLHFLLPRSSQVLSLTIPDALAPDERPLANLILTLAFYACLIATLLIWLYPLLKRLMILRRAAQAFGQGDLSARVATSRLSYIGDIELEFNRMADRIQTLIDDNKLLGRAVSHNLKTPLARLRFGVDMLEETQDAGLRRKYGQRINKDLSEMESLVHTLLQYARLDEAGIQLHTSRLDLRQFVQRLCAESGKPGIDVVCEPAETDAAEVEVDPNYLAILLNNVMDNALKHARATVRVAVGISEDGVSLSVEDDGPGIPAADRAEVIKPFWRGAQEAPGEGHGMGLAIVARIAAWFDIDLHIGESAALGGAAIRLCFHRAPLRDQIRRAGGPWSSRH